MDETQTTVAAPTRQADVPWWGKVGWVWFVIASVALGVTAITGESLTDAQALVLVGSPLAGLVAGVAGLVVWGIRSRD